MLIGRPWLPRVLGQETVLQDRLYFALAPSPACTRLHSGGISLSVKTEGTASGVWVPIGWLDGSSVSRTCWAGPASAPSTASPWQVICLTRPVSKPGRNRWTYLSSLHFPGPSVVSCDSICPSRRLPVSLRVGGLDFVTSDFVLTIILVDGILFLLVPLEGHAEA